MTERRFAYTWSRTWEDRPYDYSARDAGLRIGRVFRIEGGPGDGRWRWALTARLGNRPAAAAASPPAATRRATRSRRTTGGLPAADPLTWH